MDPALLQLLAGAGLAVGGYLFRHFAGAPAPATPAAVAPPPAAQPTSFLATLSPVLLNALQQQFTAAQLQHDLQLVAPLLAQYGFHAPAAAVTPATVPAGK